MNNYILNTYTKTSLQLTPEAAENLKRYTPCGCLFDNYTMLDLLLDLVKMYSWKLENGKKYGILDFLTICNDTHAETYKTGFYALLNEF